MQIHREMAYCCLQPLCWNFDINYFPSHLWEGKGGICLQTDNFYFRLLVADVSLPVSTLCGTWCAIYIMVSLSWFFCLPMWLFGIWLSRRGEVCKVDLLSGGLLGGKLPMQEQETWWQNVLTISRLILLRIFHSQSCYYCVRLIPLLHFSTLAILLSNCLWYYFSFFSHHRLQCEEAAGRQQDQQQQQQEDQQQVI